MNNEDERVALQAIEFWSTVCDEEIELKDELLDVSCVYAKRQRNRRLHTHIDYRLMKLENSLTVKATISLN